MMELRKMSQMWCRTLKFDNSFLVVMLRLS